VDLRDAERRHRIDCGVRRDHAAGLTCAFWRETSRQPWTAQVCSQAEEALAQVEE